MNKNYLEVAFTKEEVEILTSVLLERSTFYTRKILEYSTLGLKAIDEKYFDECEKQVKHYENYKSAIDKFYKIFEERGEQ